MGQTRVLAILGGVLAAGIAAAIWLTGATETESAQGASLAEGAAAQTAPAAAAKTAAAAKKAGTAAVFGEIRRSEGRAAVAGQEVILAAERGEPRTVTTDAQGAFRFDDLPHGGPYELSAAAKGCGTIRIPGIALDRNERRNVGTLWLDPAVKVTVRVRTYADEPVAGALVEAFAVPQWVDWNWSKALAQVAQAPVAVLKVATDARGEAAIPEISVGQWTFTARKAGFAIGAKRGVSLRTGDEPAPITILLASGHPLDGRVLGADGTPLAAALVLASRTDSAWDFGSAPERLRTTTDPEGRYAFDALGAGDVQLWIGRGKGSPEPVATVRIPYVAHYDIRLRGLGTLAGTVTEKEGGKPVAGVTVRAGNWEWGAAHSAEAVTDEGGHWSLQMTAGLVNTLEVERKGWLLVVDPEVARTQRVAVLREGETVTKDLVLRKAGTLCGVVRGPAGPLAGAQVSALFVGSNWDQKTATADGSGRYEFAALEKGTYLVLASKDGFFLEGEPEDWWQAAQAADAAKEFKVEVGESGEAAKDLVLKAGVVVEGTVQGPDGPLAGVRVRAGGAPESAPTGKDGAFRVVGVKPSKEVQFETAKEGYVPVSGPPVQVVADAPTAPVVLRMRRAGRVQGTVSTPDGSALRDAWVRVTQRSDGDNPWFERWRGQTAEAVPVRSDGAYEAPLPFDPSGKLCVQAGAEGFAETDALPVDLVATQESYRVDLVLSPGADLVGRVVAKGDVPIAHAEVSLATHQDESAGYVMMMPGGGQFPVWAVTDADGTFRIPHLAAAKVDLRASAHGFVAAQTTADLAQRAPVKIELAAELSIAGTVTYGDGRPVAGLEIAIPDERERTAFGGILAQERHCVSDANGAFRIPGVPEGIYALKVDVPWGAEINVRPRRVEAIPAGRQDVRVVVEAGATICGHVVDAKRRPVAQCWINASPSDTSEEQGAQAESHTCQVRPDGTFTLSGLEDRPQDLSVQSNSSNANYRQARVAKVAVGTKDLEIVLQDGLTIAGVVVDESGKPVGSVAVLVSQQGEAHDSYSTNAWTDSNGKFALLGLEPGQYTVDHLPWDQDNVWVFEAPVTCAAGTTDLRIVATKGLPISGTVVDESGAPIANAEVKGDSAKGGAARHAQSGADGKFRFGAFPASSTITLTATAAGHAGLVVRDVAPGTKDVKIVLGPGLTASGRVLDAAGAAAGILELHLRCADGRCEVDAETDKNGAFSVAGLAAGTYEVKARPVRVRGAPVQEWKSAGALKAGDSGVELRLP
jgi:uncharacterized GH25 family protein